MKNLFESFKIYEAKKGVEQCIQDYGKFLFGEMLGKGEPDTDKEEKLLDQILTYVQWGDNGEVNDVFYDNLIKLKKCIDQYSKVLTPDKKVYRGLGFDEIEHLEKFVGVNIKDIEFINHPRTKEDFIKNNGKKSERLVRKIDIGEVKYSPKKMIESWSSNILIAKGFALEFKRFGVLLESHTNNDFMFNAEHFNELTDDIGFMEFENLYLGGKPMTVKATIFIEVII